MIKKLFIIFLMGVTTFLFAQTIAPKKCNTCGKPLSQCQYKGRHPQKTPQPVHPSKPTSGYENGYEWVDLGLSVKWATKNVGASTPSDYGGYYAWGETRIKSIYTFSNCFDCLDDTGNSWGTYKYNGRTQITPFSGHDTARENWGVNWRMPTNAEFEELLQKCKWVWTSVDNHTGYRITGSTGRNIFLPAADIESHLGKSRTIGMYGHYWSSSLCTPCIDYSSSGFASALYFNESGSHYMENRYRSYGLTIRPVLDN